MADQAGAADGVQSDFLVVVAGAGGYLWPAAGCSLRARGLGAELGA